MVQLQNIGVFFGAEALFEGVSFQINERERIGLAGKNGAGKSTLLKIISGTRKADAGNINMPNYYKVSYLKQDLDNKSDLSVWDETDTAFRELNELHDRVEQLEHEVSDVNADHSGDAYMNKLDELHDLSTRLHLLGAAHTDAAIEQVLLGLGFEREHFTRPLSTFSGGWQMRVELAKLLLQQPDLLLLDEPTNHLDIESIQWLEQFLQSFRGAVVLVSHDKRFLDMVTKRTIEITNGRIEDYKANYSKYVELRKERREILESSYKNQQRQIEKTEALIDKFRAKASKAKQAQSLIKQLDRTERIELDIEDTSAMKFRFPDAPRCGQQVLKADHLKKAYGDKEILHDINIDVTRGDRIAFVGKNGEGKTTLAKMLVGEEPLTAGHVTVGHNVKIGYYAQQQAEKLDGNDTVFDTIDQRAKGEMRTKVRSLLGAFLFGGDDVDKKVKVLSGGEKSRVALACLLLEPYNVLVMDEPTNHLDMRSKEILKEALMNYNGTLIVVSHDRDFLQGLTNRLFYFRGGGIKEHIGDIDDFLSSQKLESLQELERKSAVKAADKAADKLERQQPAPTKASDNGQPLKPKRNAHEQKQLENKLKKLEKQVEESDRKLKTLEDALANPSGLSSAALQEKVLEYEKVKQQNAQLTKDWEAVVEEME